MNIYKIILDLKEPIILSENVSDNELDELMDYYYFIYGPCTPFHSELEND